jgi:hypothetical protein
MSKPKYAVRLSVLLIGDDLHPADLSLIIGLNPDRRKYKGEIIAKDGQKPFVHKTGLWGICSNLVEVYSDTPPNKLFEIVFLELLPKLDHLKSCVANLDTKLSELPKVDYAYADFFIYKITDNLFEPCEFVCTESQSKCFFELGLPLHFSVSLGSE